MSGTFIGGKPREVCRHCHKRPRCEPIAASPCARFEAMKAAARAAVDRHATDVSRGLSAKAYRSTLIHAALVAQRGFAPKIVAECAMVLHGLAPKDPDADWHRRYRIADEDGVLAAIKLAGEGDVYGFMSN